MLAKKLGVTADYLETGSEIRDTDERELRIADAELELRLADDPAEAEQKLEPLRDEAVAAGDALAASRANIALGLAAAAAGRNADAIERLEAGLELSPVSPSGRPDVFATLGRAYAATVALGQGRRGVRAQPRRRSSEDAPEDAGRAGPLHDLPQLRAHGPGRPRARAGGARRGARRRQTR